MITVDKVMSGENFDFSSEPNVGGGQAEHHAGSERRYLGVTFACCGIYCRVYLNDAQTAYVGNCPRCYKKVKFRVGSGGSDDRFFTAY